jgi:hypothetical protein
MLRWFVHTFPHMVLVHAVPSLAAWGAMAADWTPIEAPSSPFVAGLAPQRAGSPQVVTGRRPHAEAHDRPLLLAPMRLVELLDESFRIVRRHLAATVGITSVFVLPVSILGAIATRSAVVGLDVRAIFDPEQAPAFGGIVAVYAAAAVQSLALALAAGPIAHVVLADRVAIDLGAQMTFGRALRATHWRGLGALAVAWVLTRLVVWTLGLVVGIGVLLAPMFVAVAPACALERLGPIRSLRRSWQLTRHRYGASLGYWLGSGVMVASISNAVSFLPQLLGVDASLMSFTISTLLTTAVTLVATAVIATATALFYLDLRVRAEGLDLELRLRELGR